MPFIFRNNTHSILLMLISYNFSVIAFLISKSISRSTNFSSLRIDAFASSNAPLSPYSALIVLGGEACSMKFYDVRAQKKNYIKSEVVGCKFSLHFNQTQNVQF